MEYLRLIRVEMHLIFINHFKCCLLVIFQLYNVIRIFYRIRYVCIICVVEERGWLYDWIISVVAITNLSGLSTVPGGLPRNIDVPPERGKLFKTAWYLLFENLLFVKSFGKVAIYHIHIWVVEVLFQCQKHNSVLVIWGSSSLCGKELMFEIKLFFLES